MTQRSIIDRSDRVGDVATQDLYIDTPIIDACVYEDNLGTAERQNTHRGFNPDAKNFAPNNVDLAVAAAEVSHLVLRFNRIVHSE